MALEAQRDDAIKNVEVAAPEISRADAEADAGSRQAGRILPSLVESSPWTLAPAESEPSARRKRRAAADPEPAAQKPRVARGAKPTRRKPQAELKTATSGAGKAAAGAETRGAKKVDSRENARPEHKRAVAPSPPAAESRAKSSPASDQSEVKARHRRIMGRYVYGTEFKPGERWKQRGRRTR